MSGTNLIDGSKRMMSKTVLLALSVGLLFSAPVNAQWPQFLGPNGDGKSPEQGLVDSFPSGGASVVWRVPGGVGMSAVAVAEGIAVTSWNEGPSQVLVALDANTGKQKWKSTIGRQYKNGQGNGPRATPTFYKNRIYAFTGDGVLCAVEPKTGDVLWSVNCMDDVNTRPSEYGMASSPLVVNDAIIVHVGAANAAVAAYGLDGRRRWTAGKGPAGYSTPTLLKLNGVEHLVCFTAMGVYGLDPATGAERWSYPFRTPYDCNTASPISVDGKLFVSAGENHGCVMLDVMQSGANFQVKEAWASVDSKSVMRNEWQTSISHNGYLYGFDNVGSAGPVSHFTCVDAKTGKMQWQRTRFGKGNLVFADGKLWITMMNGELIIVSATPDAYQELGRSRLFGKTRQSLSIANGHGFIRDDKEVVCIKLTAN